MTGPLYRAVRAALAAHYPDLVAAPARGGFRCACGCAYHAAGLAALEQAILDHQAEALTRDLEALSAPRAVLDAPGLPSAADLDCVAEEERARQRIEGREAEGETVTVHWPRGGHSPFYRRQEGRGPHV